MPNFMILVLGELKRMIEYNIAAASIVVALIWIGVLYLTEIKDISLIFPLLLFIDTTSMAILMVGVTIFFEKQEGSLRAIMVSPINKTDYLFAKIVVTIFASIITLVLLYSYAALFKSISLNFFSLLGSVILIALFHSLIGFILSYYSKDFTTLLMNMFVYLLVFMLPTLFEHLKLVQNDLIGKLLYIAPTKAALTLLYASTGTTGGEDLIYALIYLVIGSIILFVFTFKQFDSFAAREGGI